VTSGSAQNPPTALRQNVSSVTSLESGSEILTAALQLLNLILVE
jgi:hypothetical protein